MFDLFSSVRVLLKLDRVCHDNNVFRLHYKATSIMLVVFSLLVTSKQYFGDPIECVLGKDTAPSRKAVNSYCWIHSTFTVDHHQGGIVGKHVSQPGVSHHVPDEDHVTYHRYYQWVCFTLFFQAILFSVPHQLWKIWEGGRLRMLSVDLNEPLVGNDAWSDERKMVLTSYLLQARGLTHNFYAARFAICEFLNLVNVMVQIYFLDVFLGGSFITYGPAVFEFIDKNIDPMDRVFPKATKCLFHYFGPSGSLQTLDSLCILSLNVVNEKIFLVLWLWYVFLTGLSALAIMYRAVVILSSTVRVYLLMAQVRFMPRTKLNALVHNISYGDWFFLRQLGKNLNPVVFRELLMNLETKMNEKVVV